MEGFFQAKAASSAGCKANGKNLHPQGIWPKGIPKHCLLQLRGRPLPWPVFSEGSESEANPRRTLHLYESGNSAGDRLDYIRRNPGFKSGPEFAEIFR